MKQWFWNWVHDKLEASWHWVYLDKIYKDEPLKQIDPVRYQFRYSYICGKTGMTTDPDPVIDPKKSD